MRKILLFLILFLPFITFARTVYLSPTGNNSNVGSFASPWKDWYIITGRVVAGDSVMIMGGTYFSPFGAGQEIHCYWNNLGGTATNHVTIMAYKNQVPIFNCSNVGTPSNPYPYEVYINNSPYLYVKGLTITGLRQNQSEPGFTRGLGIVNSPNVTIELCTVTRIGGSGFQVFENSNDVLFKNCDAFFNDDRYSTGGAGAFGGADGFDVTGGVNSNRTVYDGCRAAYNSDDGWDCFNTDTKRTWINCWGIANGYYKDSAGVVINAGDGNNFKAGPFSTDKTDTDTLRIFKNCLAVYGRLNGFDQNGTPTTRYQLYNCTAYKNLGYGFQFQYYPVNPITQTFKNNIAFQNTQGAILYVGSNVNNTNNSWSPGYTVTAADFQGTDSAGIMGARQSDGSLPYLPFMRLVAGSDLVNTGVDVGLPFCGTAPDLGAFELCVTPALTATCASNVTITLPTTVANISGIAAGGQVPYTYTWRQIIGTVSTITNTTVASTSVNNLTTAGVRTYEFKVQDFNGATALDTMSVTVNAAPATPPTCSAGTTPITITLPTNSFALNGTGASTAGNTVSFLWGFTLGSGTIVNPNIAVTSASVVSSGNYTVSFLVTDLVNGLTCTSSKSITVNPQPVIPVANAGTDQVLTLPTNSTTLNGSGSGGTITAYSWSIIQGLGGSLGTPNAASTSLTGLSVGVYKIRLQVTNNFSNTGADTVQVTVNPAPVAPSCSAGSTPVNVQLPTNTVALTASGNSNSGNSVSFLWSQTSGGAVTINNANTANATAVGLTVGTRTFQVLVTDLGNSLTCTSNKTVNVISAPVFPPVVTVAPASQTITLPTNIVSLTSTSTTPQGTITAKNWTQTFGTTATITSPTANNTFITNLTTAGIRRFKFCATNSDGLTACDSLSVTVNPLIVPTAVCAPNITIALPVNFCTLSGTGTGAIPLSYTWTNLAGSTGTIVTPNATSTQYTNLTAGSYQIEYKVVDANGSIAKDTMTVTVEQQPNIPPVVTVSPKTHTISLPTSQVSVSGTVIVSNGTLAGVLWNQVSGGGSLTITTPSSTSTTITGFTTAGTYTFRLKGQDSNGLISYDTLTVIVQQTTTGNGLRYFNAVLYPNGVDGDTGWTFDYKQHPTTQYMIGQMSKDNGTTYVDYGARILPVKNVVDYWSFFSLKGLPKGNYFFRAKQVDAGNFVYYSTSKKLVKKK